MNFFRVLAASIYNVVYFSFFIWRFVLWLAQRFAIGKSCHVIIRLAIVVTTGARSLFDAFEIHRPFWR